MRIMKTILFLFIMTLSAFAQQQEAGIVLSVSGDVRLEGAGVGGSLPVAVKTIIYQDDTIITGADGRAQILFRDDTIMSLSPDTELALMDFDFTNSGSSFAANIAKGVARVVTGEIVKRNPEGFNITTPHASISIRGTTVTTLVLPNGTSAIVNDATAGRPVVMTTIATNEIISTDMTGIVLHANSDGSADMRTATPEEMRLSQQVSPLLSVGGEAQGVDTPVSNLPNDPDNNMISNLTPVIPPAPVSTVSTFSGALGGSYINTFLTSESLSSFSGNISFNVDMSDGKISNIDARVTLGAGEILMTQQMEDIYVQSDGTFNSNLSATPNLNTVSSGMPGIVNHVTSFVRGTIAGPTGTVVVEIATDGTYPSHPYVSTLLNMENNALTCTGYCQ